jgi:hypothetical protein
VKKEEEDDFEFTMIGDAKPPAAKEPEQEIEISEAMASFTPFGKKKAKKRKKLPNFDELDNIEAFNIE